MSEPVNGASERSERSAAERCGASERSERCERTNVASDRVACSKRDRLGLETPSQGEAAMLTEEVRGKSGGKMQGQNMSRCC